MARIASSLALALADFDVDATNALTGVLYLIATATVPVLPVIVLFESSTESTKRPAPSVG
ncbi:MAG: hypothetical protein IPF73_06975 [Betaproteobacteria bacterium]|nr:hypothetical protein [Betaproteobacteria bacterium]